ncbi:MAG: hypothetical protein HZA50_00355 [Planctomycetes bacterium]|nr:hypothetical protein [Planctomycetota bacterium]
MEELNIGIQEPKPPGMMRLMLSRWRKPKAKQAKQLLAAAQPWQNMAHQVELPSRRWLENAQIGSNLPN